MARAKLGGAGRPAVSLRARLFGLLVVIGSLLAADRAAEIVRARDRLIATARDRLVNVATAGASRQEDIVSDVRSLLTVVAEMPEAGARAGGACRQPFSRVVDSIPWLLTLASFSPDGSLLCSTMSPNTAFRVADRDYFRTAVETRSFVLSGYLTSRSDNRPGLIAVIPRVQDGEIETVITARIDVDWLSAMITRLGETAGASVVLSDAAGSIVSATPDRDGLAGASVATLGLPREGGSAGRELTETVSPDGTARLWAAAPLRYTGGRLFVGVDRDEILAPIRRDVAYAILKLVGGLLACAGLFWLGVERFVVQPARSLADTSARLGAGDLSARADRQGLPREFQDLSRALNGMASRLAQRDSELRTVNEHLAALATVDALTGLANRRLLDERLAQEWRRAQRSGRPLGLAILDIDHFKGFNDTYGHPAGDACLREVARIVGADLRPGDLAARMGGEEFALLLPGADLHRTLHVARLARLGVQSAGIVHAGTPAGVVTISIGAGSVVPQAAGDAEELIRLVDEALYESKRKGRNRVTASDRLAAAS